MTAHRLSRDSNGHQRTLTLALAEFPLCERAARWSFTPETGCYSAESSDVISATLAFASPKSICVVSL